METESEEPKKGKKLKTFSVGQKRRIIEEIERDEITIEQAMEKYSIGSKRTLMSWVPIFSKEPSKFTKARNYAPSTRRQVALLIQSGNLAIEDAVKQYSVGIATIRSWLVEVKNPIPNEAKSDESQEVADLRLRVQALETMIDLAEQEFNIPIRKKCGTKQ